MTTVEVRLNMLLITVGMWMFDGLILGQVIEPRDLVNLVSRAAGKGLTVTPYLANRLSTPQRRFFVHSISYKNLSLGGQGIEPQPPRPSK